MKKHLTITTALILCSIGLFAQTKLADTTRIKLTPAQVIAISSKVDSMQMLLTNTSTLPANQIAAFNSRVQLAFIVLWKQVQQQVVADKAKGAK